MTRHVIIGAGVAGYSAAHTLRSLDPAAEVVLVCEDPHGFYSRPGLAYLLTGEIPEKQLFPFSKKGWPEQGVHYIHSSVKGLDLNAHTLELEGASHQLTYDRLMIATGASSVPLQVPGADLQGLVKLDDLQDVRIILKYARKGRTAVVAGGGVVGIELVEGLVARGLKVHYLLRGDWFWPSVLLEPEARWVEHLLKEDGVSLHYRSEIAAIEGRGGRVSLVRTTTGETLPCSLVGVGIGVRPRMELARSAGLKTDRAILVDEYLRTSSPEVYAAGDVAQVFDPLRGEASIDNLWQPARRQGITAAYGMAGQAKPYQRQAAMNVLRLGGLMTTLLGAIGTGREEGPVSTARGSSESWRRLPNTIATESGSGDSHVRLVMDEHHLLGALVMGDQHISHPLRDLIQSRTDITADRSELLGAGDRLGARIMALWEKDCR